MRCCSSVRAASNIRGSREAAASSSARKGFGGTWLDVAYFGFWAETDDELDATRKLRLAPGDRPATAFARLAVAERRDVARVLARFRRRFGAPPRFAPGERVDVALAPGLHRVELAAEGAESWTSFDTSHYLAARVTVRRIHPLLSPDLTWRPQGTREGA